MATPLVNLVLPDPAKKPLVSIIAPVYNEERVIGAFVERVAAAVAPLEGRYDFEIVLVDDGSRDHSLAVMKRCALHERRLRVLELRRNYGQTSALQAGLDAARGDIFITMDADLQHFPEEIPQFLARLDEGYDLVCGWRQRRQDTLILRKVPSWVANRIIRRLTGVQITDNGCSLKAYRRDLLSRISLYAEQHRFIPALSASVGARITELPVRHHARRYGESKYGISRTMKVLVDLLTLKMITTFRSRPLIGFAVASVPMVLAALAFGVLWIYAATHFGPLKSEALVFPAAALLWLGAAFYLAMLGLVAEVALSSERESAGHIPTAWEVR